jgi:DNA/RNA-binding domain of Phe-tRNA-synthetase-like protein
LRFIGSILERYSSVNIGILKGRGLSIYRCVHGLEVAKSDALPKAQLLLGGESVTSHPLISSWRAMYRSFGTKPSDYRPSAEALLRRTIKLGCLPTINTAVDSYNLVSLRYFIPMGGFDMDKINGDIELRTTEGGEIFTPLGPGKPETTYSGEIVYADDERILTRRWNYRDCEETKITTDTRDVLIFVDGSKEFSKETIGEALDLLESLLTMYCGGSYKLYMANRHESMIEL